MWNYKPWSAQGKLLGLLALDSLLAWHQGDQVAGSSLGTDEIFGPEDGMFDCLTHPYAFYVYFLYVYYYGIIMVYNDFLEKYSQVDWQSQIFSLWIWGFRIRISDWINNGDANGSGVAWLAISPLLVPVETAWWCLAESQLILDLYIPR